MKVDSQEMVDNQEKEDLPVHQDQLECKEKPEDLDKMVPLVKQDHKELLVALDP